MILAPTLSLLSTGSGAALQRPTFSRDFAGEKTLNHGTGPAINFTRASDATFFDANGVLQTAANDVPRFDHSGTGSSLGLLIEEARTNSLRNSQGGGSTNGVIGSGGVMPNNWETTVVAGVSHEVVGTGTQNGFSYVDIRYFGTRSGGGSNFNSIRTEDLAQIVAAQNDTWTSSAYIALVGGNLTGLTNPRLQLVERDSGGASLGTTDASISSVTATLQRFVVTRTLASASTARVHQQITFSIADGSSVNLTLRIAAPQLEKGAFATSYIPTTGSAATRSADLAVVTPVSGFVSATEGTLFAEFRTRTVSGTRVAASLDDDTADERIRLLTDGTDPRFVVTGGGSPQADIDAGTVAAETIYKMCAAFKVDDFAVSLNGATVGTDTSGTIPALTHLRIGSGPSGDRMNGGIRKIAYHPKRLTNALLEQLST